MFLYSFLTGGMIPFPFQIHSLPLFFRHQTDLIVLVLDHAPFLIFAPVHDCVDGVVLFAAF